MADPNHKESSAQPVDAGEEFKVGQKRAYLTPLEPIGKGGMGRLFKVRLERDEFVPSYVLSHILSGDISPKLVGIYGRYRLHDPEFEDEVRKRLAEADRRSFLFMRMLAELEMREYKLAQTGYVAAAKFPTGNDPGLIHRFLREARSLHNMGDHPHIVKYIACDTIETRPILIMEYFPAVDLADILHRRAMPVEEALRTFVAMLKAVHHAHTKGILHRDIKPANILSNGPEIKITDFGLAKPIDPTGLTRLTMTDEMVGTPGYMSPEQIDPKMGEVGEWTDVYQLGITLFEIVARRPMYDEAEYRSRVQTPKGPLQDSGPKEAILSEVRDLSRLHPHFPRDFTPELSDEVEKLIMTLCQKEPLERYPCDLALEHAEELLNHKLFSHAEPYKPPSAERKRESRTALILSATEAMMAKRAFFEADAYEKASSLLARAESETDILERADLLREALKQLASLPKAKFKDLHARGEALAREVEAIKDDIEAFRPNRKIALEITEGYERLVGIVEAENFYEVSLQDLRQMTEALRTRAEQHLERIQRTGLSERIAGRYIARLQSILTELPRLERSLADRKTTFVRKKREELRKALKENLNEAALLALTLKRALECGEPDEESRAFLAELETTILPQVRSTPFQ